MFDKIIEKNFQQQLDCLKEIINIPSVGGDSLPGKPYGEKCAEVLEKFLSMAEKEGFYTKNIENYAGTIEYNNKDKAKLGVLCHLDVVPVIAEDWKHKPFDCEIENGRIYGRGAIDDKGPACAVLFALKAIKEAGVELSNNVRFIVGCDEERGSSDMEYYMSKEEMPPYVFTPDGDYPIINIEKGMLRLDFSRQFVSENILSINGGTVVNAVPASASAVIRGIDKENLKSAVHKNDDIEIKEDNNAFIVTYRGLAAHASTPDKGINAITGLISYISRLELPESEKKFFMQLSELFIHGDFSGKGLKINISDEVSGELTSVLSMIEYDGNTLDMKMDIRYPVCQTKEKIKETVVKSVSESGLTVEVSFENNPHVVDEKSEFVQTLLKVYTEQTGAPGYCQAIGGGTYVHDIEGGVAFGAEFPGEVNNMHGNDESMALESLMLNTKIIANAIYEICK